jgi:hypothetical protein
MEALNGINLGWFIDFVMGFCKVGLSKEYGKS